MLWDGFLSIDGEPSCCPLTRQESFARDGNILLPGPHCKLQPFPRSRTPTWNDFLQLQKSLLALNHCCQLHIGMDSLCVIDLKEGNYFCQFFCCCCGVFFCFCFVFQSCCDVASTLLFLLQGFTSKEIIGFTIGSVSSVLYLCSRLPQIYTNVSMTLL